MFCRAFVEDLYWCQVTQVARQLRDCALSVVASRHVRDDCTMIGVGSHPDMYSPTRTRAVTFASLYTSMSTQESREALSTNSLQP